MGRLRFTEARECITDTVKAALVEPPVETVPLGEAAGRVLAEEIRADRDYPPTDRSLRDGYAVCAADLPGELELAGEARAGDVFAGETGRGQAVEIMTGAPLPRGADAVVMVERVERRGSRVYCPEPAAPGDFVNPQGAEARRGDLLLSRGARLSYSGIAAAAMTGHSSVRVFRMPRVAILATGDEVVAVEAKPLAHQVRNSSAYSLAAQVRRAGGLPEILPAAPDSLEATRELARRGLECDLLLVAGGVSAGKYDVVEEALGALGAEFYFDGVLMQPGRPLVFGRARGTFFFGLPGNPVSTMVTFEVLARAAVELLGGQWESELPFTHARLTEAFRHRTGLTRFLPARLAPGGSGVTPVAWQGSSDIAAMARANALMVAEEDRESWEAGEWIRVLPK